MKLKSKNKQISFQFHAFPFLKLTRRLHRKALPTTELILSTPPFSIAFPDDNNDPQWYIIRRFKIKSFRKIQFQIINVELAWNTTQSPFNLPKVNDANDFDHPFSSLLQILSLLFSIWLIELTRVIAETKKIEVKPDQNIRSSFIRSKSRNKCDLPLSFLFVSF